MGSGRDRTARLGGGHVCVCGPLTVVAGRRWLSICRARGPPPRTLGKVSCLTGTASTPRLARPCSPGRWDLRASSVAGGLWAAGRPPPARRGKLGPRVPLPRLPAGRRGPRGRLAVSSHTRHRTWTGRAGSAECQLGAGESTGRPGPGDDLQTPGAQTDRAHTPARDHGGIPGRPRLPESVQVWGWT